MTKLADQEIDFKFSPRRRSIGLTVTTDGKLVITAPAGASRASLNRALERHRAWIEKTVAARRQAWEQLQPGLAFFLGRAYRLAATPGEVEAVGLTGGEIRVQWRRHGGGPWPALAAWYRRQAAAHLRPRVGAYAARMGLQPGAVELKDWKRRWGECHPDGHLRFNWRLILLPPAVVDYVVVHELAHLKVPGHNPRFWRAVAAILPDWAARRQWLNRDGSPFLLWQP